MFAGMSQGVTGVDTTTFELEVNAKAGAISLPNGYVAKGGETVWLTLNQFTEISEDIYTKPYRDGKPLLRVVKVPGPLRVEVRPWEDGPLDFAYPLKVDLSNKYEELRYSLRTIPNVKGAGRVYIAGGVPSWINTERVTAISVPQVPGKYAHAGQCLEAILESDISDPFVWMNDDMMFLTPTDDIPAYARRMSIAKFCEGLRFMGGTSRQAQDHNEFVRAMKGQMKIVKAWGFDPYTEYAGDTHHPLLVDKQRLADIIARVRREFPHHPFAAWKMIYNAGQNPVPSRDAKLMKHNSPLPDGGVVSFDDRSWNGQAGKWVRLMFSQTGPFEK